MIFGRVYKIINCINDKVYVGSTKQLISRRMASHRRTVRERPRSYFHKEMLKLGPDNFKIILLEEVKTETEEGLRQREDYWIQKLNTYKTGYNMKHAIFNKEVRKASKAKYNNSEKCKETYKQYRLRKKEQKDKEESEDSEESEKEIKEETKKEKRKYKKTVKTYSCELCKHSFKRNCDLTRHNKTDKHMAKLYRLILNQEKIKQKNNDTNKFKGINDNQLLPAVVQTQEV